MFHLELERDLARLKRTVKSLIDGWVRDRHFPPGLTNMGPLDPGRLYFDGFPDHARLLVPPIHPPGLGVGLSGYRGALTLSAGVYPETGGDQVAAKFLDGIVAELAAALR
jgi:NRPS condensation-like uncharacterized protein